MEELQYYFEQTQAAEHLEEAYRYVGRKPKRGLEQVWMIEILGETWMQRYTKEGTQII